MLPKKQIVGMVGGADICVPPTRASIDRKSRW